MLNPTDVRMLFDACPDVVYFTKDRLGSYTGGNRTLLQRLGLDDESDLIGKDPRELFPAPLGESYWAQDQRVIASGQPLLDELERHLFPNHAHGWCLTRKLPLREGGRAVGLIGISRDLPATPHAAGVAQRMRGVIDHVHANYGEALRIASLARIARLSVAQFERQFVRLMQLTPRGWLISVRLDAAMLALEQGSDSIAAIAQACGFADQSAFARTFRKHVGITPTAYRASCRASGWNAAGAEARQRRYAHRGGSP